LQRSLILQKILVSFPQSSSAKLNVAEGKCFVADSNNQSWTENGVTVGSFDKATGVLVCNTSHFSTFAYGLGAVQPPKPPPTTKSTTTESSFSETSTESNINNVIPPEDGSSNSTIPIIVGGSAGVVAILGFVVVKQRKRQKDKAAPPSKAPAQVVQV
jgi:hypothetical protein